MKEKSLVIWQGCASVSRRIVCCFFAKLQMTSRPPLRAVKTVPKKGDDEFRQTLQTEVHLGLCLLTMCGLCLCFWQ